MRPTPSSSSLTLLRTSVRALRLPGHALRQVAEPVDFETVSSELRLALVSGLAGALFRGPVGAGLAAPMAGVGLRLIVTDVDGRTMALFNPQIVERSQQEETFPEGNLCLPGVRAEVRRPMSVTVTWQTLSGATRTERFEGWHARVLQHEIEILDGQLFLDHEGALPLGALASADERAARAAAAIFGEETPERQRVEPLAIATFDPPLAALESIVVRHAAVDVPLELDRNVVRALAEGLLRTQFEHGGVGLASPQVGLSLRMAAIAADQINAPLLLINPVIVDASEEVTTIAEGCLSIPGWRGEVERPERVKIRNRTIDGDEVELDLEGFSARVAQHEIDHLDGVLFTDRMGPDAALYAASGPARASDALDAIVRDAREAPAPPPASRKNKKRR